MIPPKFYSKTNICCLDLRLEAWKGFACLWRLAYGQRISNLHIYSPRIVGVRRGIYIVVG